MVAEHVDAIAYPGLTANFDAGRVAVLAVTMLDWTVPAGSTRQPWSRARALVTELAALNVAVFAADRGFIRSHQFAVGTPEIVRLGMTVEDMPPSWSQGVDRRPARGCGGHALARQVPRRPLHGVIIRVRTYSARVVLRARKAATLVRFAHVVEQKRRDRFLDRSTSTS